MSISLLESFSVGARNEQWWVGCNQLCEILMHRTTVWSTWYNNVTFHLNMCCFPNKWWLVMFKKKNVWFTTNLSENIKPVKTENTSMTDESWKAIVNRHLKGSRKIYFNTLITYTKELWTPGQPNTTNQAHSTHSKKCCPPLLTYFTHWPDHMEIFVSICNV